MRHTFLLVGLPLMSVACLGPATDSGTGSATESDDGNSSEPWFEIGKGLETYEPFADGDPFPIVFGGQGLAMFTLPIRGGAFPLPPDPLDYTHEKAPLLDLWVDVEGHNDGVGGHFTRLANYRIPFQVLDDGSYEFVYVTIIVPDEVDPFSLEGLSGHIWVQLRAWQTDPLVEQRDFVVAVPGDVPG